MPNITGANQYIEVPPVAPRIGGVLSVAHIIPASGHALIGAEFQSDACAVGGIIEDFCESDQTIGQCVPPIPDPTITSLNPNTLPASAPATLITVTGTLFEAGSVVEVNQVAQPTTFVNSTTLTIMYDPTAAGTAEFTVRNPNDEESNSVPFTITGTAGPAAPTLASVTPTVLWNGDPSPGYFTVTGSGFYPDDVEESPGIHLVTTFEFVGLTPLTDGYVIQKNAAGANSPTQMSLVYQTFNPFAVGSYQLQAVTTRTNDDDPLDRQRFVSGPLPVTTDWQYPPPILTSVDTPTIADTGTVHVLARGTFATHPTQISLHGFQLDGVSKPHTKTLDTATTSWVELASPGGSGTHQLTALDYASRSSNPITLTVSATAPKISSIAPTAALINVPTTVTINGSNFTAAAVVYFNYVAVPTTFVSATQLTCTITGTVAGSKYVWVQDGTGTSNGQFLAINASSLDPSEFTIDQIKEYIDALPDNGNNHSETQAVLDAERAGQARVTLIAWLDSKEGMI